MGIGPNGTNFVKMGGVTTPAIVTQTLKASTPAPKQMMKPLNTPPAGSNAQSEAYGKAMNNAFKNAKVYGSNH